MSAMASRFQTLNELDLQHILDERDSKNTKSLIKAAVGILSEYAIHKNTMLQHLETSMTISELDTFLRSFYAEARKADGTRYVKKSIVSIRYGIQKHFYKVRNGIDIVNDPDFVKSNDMFKGVLVKLKKDGVGEHKQKPIIPSEDIERLYATVFDTDTPRGLQNKTIFEYLYFFCNRGRENLRELLKTDLTLSKDSSGREYVSLSHQRQTKNHRGDVHDKDQKQGRMYDKPGKNF